MPAACVDVREHDEPEFVKPHFEHFRLQTLPIRRERP